MLLKNIALFFIGFAFSSTACAQLDSTAIKYAQEINEKDARKHLTILASDEFEGRDTGKPGGQKAAQYIADEFKKLNLGAPVSNNYFQPVELIETGFAVTDFRIDGESFQLGNGYYITGSGGEKTINSNNIVFIGYGISTDKYDDLQGIDIEGKVVLLINESRTTANQQRLKDIIAKNPMLIMAVSSEVDPFLESYGHTLDKSRLMLKDDYKVAPYSIPVAHLSPAFANTFLKKSGTSVEKLKELIRTNGKPATQVLKINVSAAFGSYIKPVESPNVLGYLEGTDLKDELLVISAHYDHVGVEDGQIFNGADDDGSGTTGVLEMARAFSKSKEDGDGPRRSILFLAVTAEEKGLLGSDYYTRYPVFPLKNTISNLNIDMIGRIDPSHESDPNYIYLIGSDKLSSELHEISEKANSLYTKLSLEYKYNAPNDPERIYYRSDHYNFAKHGIPVIFYFNGVHADYHKPSDTVDKINFELLVKRTRLVFHTAWEIANRDNRLVVDVSNK